jgi:hypothetical protein
MKAPHLLRVEEGPERYAELIAAARAEKLRVGWLELAAGDRTGAAGSAVLSATEEASDVTMTLPASLEAAAAAGCLRAVVAGGRRTVAVKPVSGPTVLRDLLREHFLGCALVLVRGDVDAPLLAPATGAWTVTTAAGAERSYTLDELAAALRKPRPWG